MRNIALTLKYLGTAYHGWQVQKTVTTVGETLENAAAAVVGHPVHSCRVRSRPFPSYPRALG